MVQDQVTGNPDFQLVASIQFAPQGTQIHTSLVVEFGVEIFSGGAQHCSEPFHLDEVRINGAQRDHHPVALPPVVVQGAGQQRGCFLIEGNPNRLAQEVVHLHIVICRHPDASVDELKRTDRGRGVDQSKCYTLRSRFRVAPRQLSDEPFEAVRYQVLLRQVTQVWSQQSQHDSDHGCWHETLPRPEVVAQDVGGCL